MLFTDAGITCCGFISRENRREIAAMQIRFLRGLSTPLVEKLCRIADRGVSRIMRRRIQQQSSRVDYNSWPERRKRYDRKP
ncbi:hypothetical protein [Caballeronia sp. DA-9]|uniref:hypothetical protein n=1 Tax=Caballeronia sp. DA-9 TaxID=3436237 RepID=UPI003F6678D4